MIYKETPFFTIDDESYYYRFVFSPIDRIVYEALLKVVLSKEMDYENGILLVNMREDRLANKIGQISLSTVKRSLKRLADMGAIIIIRHRHRNNQYILGFRHKDGRKRLYFLDYLVAKFEDLVRENVRNQNKTCPEIDIKAYCLKEFYKTFIKKNFTKPHTLFGIRLESGLTIMELLFGESGYYEKPLQKQNATPNNIAHFEPSQFKKLAVS